MSTIRSSRVARSVSGCTTTSTSRSESGLASPRASEPKRRRSSRFGPRISRARSAKRSSARLLIELLTTAVVYRRVFGSAESPDWSHLYFDRGVQVAHLDRERQSQFASRRETFADGVPDVVLRLRNRPPLAHVAPESPGTRRRTCRLRPG